jgi:AraC-like DNA-binding protein
MNLSRLPQLDVSAPSGSPQPGDRAATPGGIPPACPFVQTQLIRTGLLMQWGVGVPDLRQIRECSLGAETILLIFALKDATSRATDNAVDLSHSDWMGVQENADQPSDAFRWQGISFHLVLALAGASWRELRGGGMTVSGGMHDLAWAGAKTPVFPLTATARLAVESIRRCPFAGPCRALMMEARCNDMLLELITALGAPAQHARPLMVDADVRIRVAAGKLEEYLDQPPSLGELAREVGLSETTLKRGFRQVFGTTVFGYLREKRMEHARALLASGRATVIEAAALVGYSNPSNFAAAFRQQFGLNPKEFQLAARR